MLARVWQEGLAARVSRLPKAAMPKHKMKAGAACEQLSRARPRAPSTSRHFIGTRKPGCRARVFGAVDRQARSHFGAACVVCGTNGRPRVAFDAGGAVRATKRLPRAARGDTRAAQLTDSPSAVRTPAPSVDAVGVRGRCSTPVVPYGAAKTLPRAALVVTGLPQLQRHRTRTLPRATEGTARRQLGERWPLSPRCSGPPTRPINLSPKRRRRYGSSSSRMNRAAEAPTVRVSRM